MSVAGSPAGHIKNTSKTKRKTLIQISVCVPFTKLLGQTELSVKQ